MDLLQKKIEKVQNRAKEAGEEYHGLVPNEQYYDSVEAQLKRREDYIDILESVIVDLITLKKARR